MDQALGLIMLSGVMLIGSFLAGSIPTIMHMSEEKVHFISVMGAGMLVGTALSVIIPEGIHTLYLAKLQKTQLATPSQQNPKLVPQSLSHVLISPSHSGASGFLPSPITQSNEGNHEHPHLADNVSDAFSSIGIALVLGFIFMLLVDQCSRASSARDVESPGGVRSQKKSITATLGLVVHAAADGIALGAAATTTRTEVEMIVFFAIMLHKAPAAFGLVTFLLHEGLERQKVRKHLAIFSFAAPVAAIITYFGISPEGKENSTTMHATAVAMLFSAGTFLYVATVHVLPEVTKDSQNGFTRKELLALIVGAISPLLLTGGHHH